VQYNTSIPRPRRILALVGLLTAAIAARAIADEPPKGFTKLFNGKDLAGWHGMPDFSPYVLAAMPEAKRKQTLDNWTADARRHWRVENEELINDGEGAFLTSDKDLGDMELLVEYRTVPLADSGIYLRATPQVQIWDYTKEGGKWNLGADKGSGGLWNNSPGSPGKDPLVLADKPFGQWNKFRILQVGERVTVYLNDKLVVNHARLENYWRSTVKPPKYNRATPLLKKAPIQLQTHGGEIRWRNIFFREIPAGEANAILRKHESEGFVDVFNGQDFSGWAGPVDQYEVKDGSIVCRPNKGGTIYTKDEYSDFVARVEFRLPPAGNNGLAIRYPGYGDGAYVGTCECQILDDSDPVYATLDPRQYCASAYGMTAVNRGYLRPVGQWNFIEVTAIGPKLTMELNGTRVTETDLSEVHEYMANSAHPGKLLSHGHFGFCGHDDPVAFRSVQIKPLKK
jgi:hypothetical protein